MDLVLLSAFLKVAEHGSITGAAHALGTTQPTLSRRIQQLEHHLDTSLMVRSRRGVVLTEMGRLVLTDGRTLLERWGRLQDRLRAHAELEEGLVRVGGGATAVSFLLPEAIAAFQRRHPGIRFQVRETGSRNVQAGVVEDELDLGIVTLPIQPRRIDELLVTPLISDQIVAVAATGHPLLTSGPLRAQSLSGHSRVGFEAGSAIRQLIDTSLRQAGVDMNVLMELRSIPAILQMVTSTQSLAFVSQLSLGTAGPQIEVLEVKGLEITRQLAVISKRDRPLSASAAEFARRLVSG